MPEPLRDSRINSPQESLTESGETTLPGSSAGQPLLPLPESGMIVFSSSARMLHMNGPARRLVALFGEYHGLASEPIPPLLTEFCRDVLAQLQHRIETQGWAEFEMHRICHMVTPPLLIRGFGVLNSTNQEFRVILTLAPQLSPSHTTDNAVLPQTQTSAPTGSARTPS